MTRLVAVEPGSPGGRRWLRSGFPIGVGLAHLAALSSSRIFFSLVHTHQPTESVRETPLRTLFMMRDESTEINGLIAVGSL